jgi:hypothetical protein
MDSLVRREYSERRRPIIQHTIKIAMKNMKGQK